jgi:multimeric flavodoxin WrbA
MRVLIVNGSPRFDGNSSRLADELTEILTARGHYYDIVDELSKSIEACMHCGVCSDGVHRCPVNDRLRPVLGVFIGYDAIVFCSPIHFFSLSPTSLKVLTRLYSVNLESKVFGLILSSGSNFRYGGADLIIEQFKRIDEYCGSITVTPYNKVTYDKILEITEVDRIGIELLVSEMEDICNEVKIKTSH